MPDDRLQTPQGQRVMRALNNLMKAVIAAEKNEDPDSMGTYHEEREFEEAFEDFLRSVVDA